VYQIKVKNQANLLKDSLESYVIAGSPLGRRLPAGRQEAIYFKNKMLPRPAS
jgi:hypothetical protein